MQECFFFSTVLLLVDPLTPGSKYVHVCTYTVIMVTVGWLANEGCVFWKFFLLWPLQAN